MKIYWKQSEQNPYNNERTIINGLKARPHLPTLMWDFVCFPICIGGDSDILYQIVKKDYNIVYMHYKDDIIYIYEFFLLIM